MMSLVQLEALSAAGVSRHFAHVPSPGRPRRYVHRAHTDREVLLERIANGQAFFRRHEDDELRRVRADVFHTNYVRGGE